MATSNPLQTTYKEKSKIDIYRCECIVEHIPQYTFQHVDIYPHIWFSQGMKSTRSVPSLSPIATTFDLDPRAAQLFDALLDLGRSTVAQLAQAAKTERTGTYDVLNRLIERGLVERHTIGKRTVFEVAAPDTIRLQVAQSLTRIDALMPELQARYAARMQAPTVRMVLGFDGAQALIERIEGEVEGELCILAPSIGLADIFDGWSAKRPATVPAQRLSVRLIVTTVALATDWQWLDAYVRSVTVRQLQPATIMTVGEVLFPRVVSYLLSEGQPGVAFIESAALAAHQRQLYELLWRAAKPITTDR